MQLHRVGTTIEVHNLFYNTPVRRKFVRSTQTEMGYVSEAFTRIALAHPHIHCTLRHQLRSPCTNLPPAAGLADCADRGFFRQRA